MAGVERQPGALRAARPASSRPDRRSGPTRPSRSPCSVRSERWAGLPLTSSSATTKISPRADVEHRRAGDPDRGRDVAAGERGRAAPASQGATTRRCCRRRLRGRRRCRSRSRRRPVRPTRAVHRRGCRRGRRGPRRRAHVDGADSCGNAGPGGVAVVDGPRGPRGRCGRRGGRAERRTTPGERREQRGGRSNPMQCVPRPAGRSRLRQFRPRSFCLSGAAWSRRPPRRAGRPRSACRSRRW